MLDCDQLTHHNYLREERWGLFYSGSTWPDCMKPIRANWFSSSSTGEPIKASSDGKANIGSADLLEKKKNEVERQQGFFVVDNNQWVTKSITRPLCVDVLFFLSELVFLSLLSESYFKQRAGAADAEPLVTAVAYVRPTKQITGWWLPPACSPWKSRVSTVRVRLQWKLMRWPPPLY